MEIYFDFYHFLSSEIIFFFLHTLTLKTQNIPVQPGQYNSEMHYGIRSGVPQGSVLVPLSFT